MWPNFTAKCIKDVTSLLRSGKSLTAYRANAQWGVKPQPWSQVHAFERELEKAFDVRHAVACNSGTMALTAAIKALGLPPGSGIVTTPYSFSATSAAIVIAGHVPQYADIDPYSFVVTKETIKAAVTRKTKALLPVDLFGYVQDYGPLREFGLPIIQDACQSQGAWRSDAQPYEDGCGKRAYLHGDIAVGSGNGGKNLPVGEGGWAYTNSAKYADRMRRYINHGCNFGDATVGVNGRMHELVAILARHGLRELEAMNEQRRELAIRVASKLAALQDRPTYTYFVLGAHVYYVVPHLLPPQVNRSTFIKRCAKRGLNVQAGYTLPLHHLPAFKRYAHGPLPVVDDVHDRLVLLTNLTPDASLKTADWTADVISEALK